MVCPITQGDHNQSGKRTETPGNDFPSMLTKNGLINIDSRTSISNENILSQHGENSHQHFTIMQIGQTITFLPCGFFLSIFFLFFSWPNLSGRRLDVYHTSTHGVALVRIQNAGLKPAARGSLKTQDAKKSPKVAIWAPSHKFVGLYLCN